MFQIREARLSTNMKCLKKKKPVPPEVISSRRSCFNYSGGRILAQILPLLFCLIRAGRISHGLNNEYCAFVLHSIFFSFAIRLTQKIAKSIEDEVVKNFRALITHLSSRARRPKRITKFISGLE